MKKILKIITEPFTIFYNRILAEKIATFLRKMPVFQYIFAAIITFLIIYLVTH